MKRNALVTLGMIAVLGAGAFGVSAKTLTNADSAKAAVVKADKIDAAQAKKIALKKIAGKVIDEFTIEDEDETVIAYVFKIETTDKKTFEVQVDAESGEIIYAEEDIVE